MNDIARIRALRARLVPMGACHSCGQPLPTSTGVLCNDQCARDLLEDEDRKKQKEPVA